MVSVILAKVAKFSLWKYPKYYLRPHLNPQTIHRGNWIRYIRIEEAIK